MNPRLYRLMEKHQRIDHLIQLEQGRRWRDPFRLIQLKKLKLRVKDLIRRQTLQAGRT